MRATAFLSSFMRLQLSPDRARTAEVRFMMKGVEVKLDLVQCEIADPVTWIIQLSNDPSTPGHVLTQDEVEAALQPRTIGED